MATTDFLLPDLGEGLTDSEIVSWRVAEGDRVELNQIIAEVETAKALVELPSPREGVIARLYVAEGVTVNVGDPIVAFETDGAADDGGQGETDDDAPPPNLVGYGATASSTEARRRSHGAPRLPQPPAAPPAASAAASAAASVSAETPRATPPVRKLARQLGIELRDVRPTGARGLITRSDVELAHGEHGNAVTTEPGGSSSAAGTTAGTTTSIPVKGVRKLTAEAMVRSAFTAPHVTVFMTVDVTRSVKLLERTRTTPAFADVRLTFLAAAARAVCLAIERFPQVNSRWDESSGSILQFGHVNLGIAAATPRGLVVPNLESAHLLDLAGIASAMSELVRTARAGRTSPEAMSGGTFTISNVGVFGVDAGTPILNDGQAAILALGAVARRPWEHKGRIRLRDVTTLSLSFDHRVLDGEQGSQFLKAVADILHDPARAFVSS